jgi:lysocardiolipin and lysophospholipid acyltransferase
MCVAVLMLGIGIPPMGYGQDYYTLRSIFFDGIPPPTIHLHLRMFDVRHDVPIGDLSSSKPSESPSQKGGTVEVDIPPAERDAFDSWIRRLWQEKDESIDNFHLTGSFNPNQPDVTVTQIPLKLRRKREILDAFCFLPGAFAYFLVNKLTRS